MSREEDVGDVEGKVLIDDVCEREILADHEPEAHAPGVAKGRVEKAREATRCRLVENSKSAGNVALVILGEHRAVLTYRDCRVEEQLVIGWAGWIAHLKRLLTRAHLDQIRHKHDRVAVCQTTELLQLRGIGI